MRLNGKQLRQAGAVTPSKGKPETTDEAVLRQEAMPESEDDGYEYVPLSEVSSGIVSKVMDVLREYSMIFLFAAVAVVCLVVSAIGEHMSSLFIAIAFALIAVIVAYILYNLWQDKREAERRYKHAKEVIEPVRDAMVSQMGEDQ